MKKSTVWTIIILLVIFGLVAYFITLNKQKRPQMIVGNGQPKNVLVTAKNSLEDLVAQGKNISCTYTSSTDNTVSSGTVYISGKNVRVDYTLMIDGKKNSGSMIRDNDFTYVWGTAMPQGIKMRNTSAELPTGSPQDKQSFDQTAKMDYKCQSWSPNNSSFTPPTNIKFSEFSLPAAQPTGAAANPAAGGNQAACAACNNLTGNTKTMCLTQLHCQ